jgi:hypothetical protein
MHVCLFLFLPSWLLIILHPVQRLLKDISLYEQNMLKQVSSLLHFHNLTLVCSCGVPGQDLVSFDYIYDFMP